MRYLSLTIPGTNGTPMQIDSNLPSGVPVGGLFDKLDKYGHPAGTGVSIISSFIILIVTISIIISLWFVLKGGWDLITSSGHKEKIHKGRDRILYALLGLIFVFMSFLMLGLANALVGTNLLPFVSFFNPK